MEKRNPMINYRAGINENAPSPATAKFGAKLDHLICSDNETAFYISKKIGISNGKLSNLRRGTVSPNLDTLIALADYFHVSINELIGIEPDKANDNVVPDAIKPLLNDDAIAGIQTMKRHDEQEKCTTRIEFVNYLLSSMEFQRDITTYVCMLKKTFGADYSSFNIPKDFFYDFGLYESSRKFIKIINDFLKPKHTPKVKSGRKSKEVKK